MLVKAHQAPLKGDPAALVELSTNHVCCGMSFLNSLCVMFMTGLSYHGTQALLSDKDKCKVLYGPQSLLCYNTAFSPTMLSQSLLHKEPLSTCQLAILLLRPLHSWYEALNTLELPHQICSYCFCRVLLNHQRPSSSSLCCCLLPVVVHTSHELPQVFD